MPPTIFGYVRRSRSTRPDDTRSGLNASEKSTVGAMPVAARDLLGHAQPRRADRHRRLDDHQHAAAQVRRDSGDRCIEQREVGPLRRVDVDRHDQHDDVGLCDGVARVGRRAQTAAHDEAGNAAPQAPVRTAADCAPSLISATRAVLMS